MALMDKHKVKRQRLDRICEGEKMQPYEMENIYPIDFQQLKSLKFNIKWRLHPYVYMFKDNI